MENKRFRHVVLFKFKEQTSKEKVTEIEKAFISLKSRIEIIIDFEWGTNLSKENLNEGFTHCFLVTFANEEHRDEYLVNPHHQEFANRILSPYLDKVCVVDYWAKN